MTFPRKIRNIRNAIEATARAEVKQLGYPKTTKDDNQVKEGLCEYHGEFELYRGLDKVVLYHRSMDLTIVGTRDNTTPLSAKNQRSKTAFITELTRRKKRILQQLADIDKQILDLVQSL
jgi:hypothetical protein